MWQTSAYQMSARKYNRERKQSRRFLKCMEENFLTYLVRKPARGGAPQDLLFVNREGRDVTVRGCLGKSNQEMIVTVILWK